MESSAGVFSTESKNSEKLAGSESRFPCSREFYQSCLSTEITEPGSRNVSCVNREKSLMASFLPPIYATAESRPVLTKPQLLRKHESELRRCKDLLVKKTVDCANAVCGERFAVEREANLRRKFRKQKFEFEGMKQMERLRNRERLIFETEGLRKGRDEAKLLSESKDGVIERLRTRVKQLKEIEKQNEASIEQLRRELETKNRTLKNLLRKLVLAQFSKKKS